ncbi:hypothetical protein [Paenibacillus kandeliae]|uniref:hypothetical protein n=1 Tax=Paenibacillus kandeliae TaxID=3231269 RepID=UPI00345ADA12
MNNQTRIKWMTGLSGALLFTGFIGWIQHNEQAEASTTDHSLAGNVSALPQNDEQSASTLDVLQQQWSEESGTLSSPSDVTASSLETAATPLQAEHLSAVSHKAHKTKKSDRSASSKTAKTTTHTRTHAS